MASKAKKIWLPSTPKNSKPKVPEALKQIDRFES
jgi:hypothetical protein